MTTVELRFTAVPAPVRTARLVAAAVARRAGVHASVLDDIRLAVGEAYTRAINLQKSNTVPHPVRGAMTGQEDCFLVEVSDDVLHSTPTQPAVPQTQPRTSRSAWT